MAHRASYTWAERQRRAALVAAHREVYGSWCPGYQRDAHSVDERVNPLTADHIYPVVKGTPEDGPLQVLCRSCNACKRDGRQRAKPQRRRRGAALGVRQAQPARPVAPLFAAEVRSRRW